MVFTQGVIGISNAVFPNFTVPAIPSSKRHSPLAGRGGGCTENLYGQLTGSTDMKHKAFLSRFACYDGCSCEAVCFITVGAYLMPTKDVTPFVDTATGPLLELQSVS